ncbi:MAG: response regulator [Kofleriaceae bacterium]
MTTRGGRILVVDDDQLVRDSLRRLLAEEGYAVDAAADGADALALVAAAPPDAILLDLMMPGMNGRQFLRALRDDPRHSGIPVLVMTAVTGLTVPAAGLGAAEVVEKPFELDDLLNKVALAVYRSRQARGTAPPPRAATPPPEPGERGVVLVALRDRQALQRLDALLSGRGYTVVSLTRVGAQLPRLARALRPRAMLVDIVDAAERGVVEELRSDPSVAAAPLIVLERIDDGEPKRRASTEVPGEIDADLHEFLALIP